MKKNKQPSIEDNKLWIRHKEENNETFRISAKKTTRWFGGARRDWNSRVFNSALKSYHRALMLKYFKNNTIANYIPSISKHTKIIKTKHQKIQEFFVNNTPSLLKTNSIIFAPGKTASISLHKNFCLISGRGRTYSRFLGFGRHNIRKLTSTGLISGLIK